MADAIGTQRLNRLCNVIMRVAGDYENLISAYPIPAAQHYGV
jgi:hypothetical protein